MIEKTKIILNLDKVGETADFNTNELLQEEQFEEFVRKIIEVKAQKDRLGNAVDRIADCQIHDAIFISGERGSGKTTFLKNYPKFLEEHQTELSKNFRSLPIIDPTLLHDDEKFLIITVSHIINFVDVTVNTHSLSEMKRGILCQYHEKLTEISEAIATSSNSESMVERIIDNQYSLGLEQKLHEFFGCITRLLDTEILLLPIDDIDMSFQHGFEVLEVVRKFLSSPYIIPVISGDYKLYCTIVEKKFTQKLHSPFFDSSKNEGMSISGGINSHNWKREIISLTEQYFDKVFPKDKRIELPSIKEILKQNISEIEVRQGTLSITLYDLCRTINEAFNYPMMFKTLSDESSSNPIPLTSLRIFLQTLSRLTPHVIDRQVNFVSHPIDSTGHKPLFIVDNNKSLCESIYYLNSNSNPLIKLSAQANISALRKNEGYMDTLLAHDLFAYKKEKGNRLEKINKFGSKKIDGVPGNKNLYITTEKYDYLTKRGGEKARFLLELFTYSDYYASHQKYHFFVAVKYFEFLLCSPDRTNNNERVTPKSYTRFLDIPNDNYIETEPLLPTDEELTPQTLDVDNINSTYPHDPFEIAPELSLSCSKMSASFIYKVRNKFINNLNVMYYNNDIEWGNENLYTMGQRISYIFLNSIAFFEKLNNRFSSKLQGVSETNIASGKSIDLISTKDNAYLFNIKPLLGHDHYWTTWFSQHPLIRLFLPHLDQDSSNRDDILINLLNTTSLGNVNNTSVHRGPTITRNTVKDFNALQRKFKSCINRVISNKSAKSKDENLSYALLVITENPKLSNKLKKVLTNIVATNAVAFHSSMLDIKDYNNNTYSKFREIFPNSTML
ncbi:hypothetical protein PQO03_17025 [Lentisphaera profundi]|uniref:Orc1-like AAA ATPase domain-containing protein n=1 Tax=Lentisphaera profundi TaxID=1658616 RepID=A0ABY7VUF9_9BACT|nr:hypothetical protein [Lentisphaera profundi]WDE97531.1 hypothetical protein PQO03_17025 [Lentisphaera profundi]